jgi:hypothetical protein
VPATRRGATLVVGQPAPKAAVAERADVTT